VKKINKEDYLPLMLENHYLRRKCSVSYAFGLFQNNQLAGFVTYGIPSSPNIAKSFVQPGYESLVLELNRLYLKNNTKNTASYLIAKSLKLLPKPSIVVSYADTSQGHRGIIYKAANFEYLGLTSKKKEWFLVSTPNIHSSSLFKNETVASLKQRHGENLQERERPIKHRYIFINSCKKYKNLYKTIIKR